jgi:sporulation and spore germination protein
MSHVPAGNIRSLLRVGKAVTSERLAVAAVPVVVAAMIGAVGCGATKGASSAAPPSRTARTFETTVYFLTEDAGAPLGVRRTLPARSPHAREALTALLDGPNSNERNRGLVTAFPLRARLVSLRLVARPAGTDAFIDLTGIPPVAGVLPGKRPSVLMRVRALTQIARTLIGLSGIGRVWVRVDSRPWDLPRIDGRLGDGPTHYQRLRGWSRICAGQRTLNERAAGLGRCFAALP